MRQRVLARLSGVLTGVTALLTAFIVQTSGYAADRALQRDKAITREDLWNVIRLVCVPGAALGLKYPCLRVVGPSGGAWGYAVLQVSPTHLLTVPTNRVTGIEDPQVQGSAATGLWQAAWMAAADLSPAGAAQLPRSSIALAVNSAIGRSQDQLHIHTSCIRADVRGLLDKNQADISSKWAPLPTKIDGLQYSAMRLVTPDLSNTNLFSLLDPSIKASPASMKLQTLVVVGAMFKDGTSGFYVLNNQAGRGNAAVGEQLLDKRCGNTRLQ